MKVNLEWVKVGERFPDVTGYDYNIADVLIALTITNKKTGKVVKTVQPAFYSENIDCKGKKNYEWDWSLGATDTGDCIYNRNSTINKYTPDEEVTITHWMYFPEYPQERI